MSDTINNQVLGVSMTYQPSLTFPISSPLTADPVPQPRPCSHRYVHLETKQDFRVKSVGMAEHEVFTVIYVRKDVFYCTKCAAIMPVMRKDTLPSGPAVVPVWYTGEIYGNHEFSD